MENENNTIEKEQENELVQIERMSQQLVGKKFKSTHKINLNNNNFI